MTKKTRKIQLFLYGITLMVSVLILGDFILPGKVFVDKVVDVKKERQQYYNPARNYHYSYKVVTNKHSFSVSEDFTKSIQHERIKYSVSILFKEINSYGLLSSKDRTIHSFRIASGCVLPLLLIIVLIIVYTSKKSFSTLLFVLQVILVLNLIILIN